MRIQHLFLLVRQYKFMVILAMLAFALPLHNKLATLLSLLFFLVWLLDGAFKEKLVRINRHGWLVWGYLSFYLFYVLSIWYTTHLKAGWVDVQIKLSLGLFPVLFASLPVEKIQKKVLLHSFVWGVFVSALVCFGAAYIRYLSNHWHEEFFYIRLANTHHPSYLSLFVNMAILILVVDIRRIVVLKQKSFYQWVGYLLMSLFFVFFIYLLNSKAGILILVLSLLGVFGVFVWHGTRKWIGALVMVSVLALFFSVAMFNARTNAKITEIVVALKKNSATYINTAESSTSRLMAWKVSREIIQEHPLGVGIGDVKPHLLEKYKAHRLTIMYELKLNSHNQYLQTTIAIGIVGGVFLVVLLAGSLVKAYRNRSILAVSFMLLFILHLLVESMLERQAGVLFFAFFTGVFLFFSPKN